MATYLTFSIVTPSFNQGRFLAETIESVISQKGDFALDYLVVDGASEDNSVDVIRHYDALVQKGEWPVTCRSIRFRWLSEPDAGQTDALLKGFRMAEGGIFAWLNSDDTYLPGALQKIADAFRTSSDAGLIYGDARYRGEDGEDIGRYRTEEFDFDKLAWFNFVCQPAAFFRREAFDAAGGLDASLRFALDYDLWIRIGRRFPCRHHPGTLATYRLHESSKTMSDATLADNAEEGLRVAMRHYGWAPLTRIYNACSASCAARLPAFLARFAPVRIPVVLACSVIRSFRLNGGIRRNDLKLLTTENFRKLFRSRREIMTGEGEER